MDLRASLTTTMLLAAAASVASAAPARAQDVAGIPPEAIIAPPPPASAQGTGWQSTFLAGAQLLRPDATVRAYDALTVTVLDPGATLTDPAYAADPVHAGTATPFTGNLTGLRAGIPGGGYWRSGISAVDGLDWSLDEDDTGPAPSYALVARDDRESVVRRVTLPHTRNVGSDAFLIATSRGLRGVLAVPAHYAPEGAGGRVIDDRGRSVAQLKKMAPDAAAALPDGTLLVFGSARYGLTFARVSPAGHVTYGHIARPANHGLGTPEQTAAGLVVPIIDLQGRSLHPGLARLSARGVLGKEHRIDDLHVAWPAGCAGPGIEHFLDRSLVGPSGTLVIAVSCWPKTGNVATSSEISTVVEVSADLRSGRVLAVTPQYQSRTIGTLPDGRLAVPSLAGGIGAVALADALPVTRGVVGAVTPRGTDQAIVRVRCQQPYGAVCNGVIVVHGPTGAYFGWAPYALPGRPGKAQSSADLTVQKSSAPGAAVAAGLPAGSTAALLPLPAQFERGSAAPPAS